MSVLITGAAGFIGSHLVERLLSRGDRVIGIDNFDAFYSTEEKRQNLAAALAHPAFRLIEADCAELDALERALEGESRTTSLSRLVELIADSLGATPALERLPMQPGDVLRTYADVSKARRLLGYEPTTPVEVGIPRFTAWLTQHLEQSQPVSPQTK